MTTYDFIAANKRRTVVLIIVTTAVVVALGWFFDRYYGGGGSFIAIAVIYSLVSALVSYYAGDKVALSLSHARPVEQGENPRLVRIVENLCITTGMPVPKIHVMDEPAINAFATGRDPQHASIAVTTGALAKLDDEELQGVLAHELSHVKNYDIRVMTVVIVLVGIIAVFGQLFYRMSWFGGRRRRDDEGNGLFMIVGIILMIFAPFVAQLIQLAVSRRREYLADASGALLTRFPEGLANALRKIKAESIPMTTASAATAHLFIASPFTGQSLANLFSTHPPLDARIKALDEMANIH